jgi:predicted nucleotide-binding protein
MSKYRQYYDEDEGDDVDFTVFLIHGRTPEIHKVERFIKDELLFNAVLLQNSFSGRNIIDKFKDEIWYNASCAVAILSPDDKLDNGNYRARQNVFYELGYCSGVFESYYDEDLENEPVIIIKEKSIDFQDVSDLLGVEYLSYTNGSIESTFNHLRKALNNLYEELGGEEEVE